MHFVLEIFTNLFCFYSEPGLLFSRTKKHTDKHHTIHSIYIRTVSSKRLLSVLLNWFMDHLGGATWHNTLGFYPDHPKIKDSNIPM